MMDHLSPSRMRTVWDDFVAFSATDDTKFTLIFVEYYNKDAARAAEDGVDAVGPGLRRHRLLGFAGAIYSDAARHAEAEAFGKKARSALGEGATNEDGKPNVYANLACGDEDAKQLYGAKGLERLRLLKARYDPQGIFSHFVPVPTA